MFLLPVVGLALPARAQVATEPPGGTDLSGPAGTALVDRALAAELDGAQDHEHPMQYKLRKASIHLTSTKEIVETQDGAVAMLVSVNDHPLSAADSQKENTRLNGLLADPGKQRHRKQSEDDDTGRALKVLRALPKAFLYRYAGQVQTATGPLEKFSFSPDPKFEPPDLETEVLTSLTGEILIDPEHARVVKLEGQLQQDVDFGWGILGRLNKGGSISIEQGDIGGGQWRIVHFKMTMSGRVLFKTRQFDTTEDESDFSPVARGMSYQQAIQMLRSGEASKPGGR